MNALPPPEVQPQLIIFFLLFSSLRPTLAEMFYKDHNEMEEFDI